MNKRTLITLAASATLLTAGFGGYYLYQNNLSQTRQVATTVVEQDDDYTFDLHENVTRTSVTFKNRFGIEIAADLYVPKNATGKLAAIPISGPFGAVKEQSSGLYANELASRGFVTIAFDNSYTGESGGEQRNVASPEMMTEDFSAAIDYLGTLDNVDREKIGVFGICGLSGMALTSATVDERVKAVATSAMYDMSNSISKGYMNSYTDEQREAIRDYLAEKRWENVDNGETGTGQHEIMFDDEGKIIQGEVLLPEELPADANPIVSMFYDYYKTDRGYHERSINSTSAWTNTTIASFFAFPLYNNIQDIDVPIMVIGGEQAHSLYHSQAIKDLAPELTELVIVPDANHVDLYDQIEKIPFDDLAQFFNKNLNGISN